MDSTLQLERSQGPGPAPGRPALRRNPVGSRGFQQSLPFSASLKRWGWYGMCECLGENELVSLCFSWGWEHL